MSLTIKDPLLMSVLLPVLVVAAYGFLWIRPTLKEQARLDASLRTLGDEAALLQRRNQLNAEQSSLRQSLAEALATSGTPQQAAPAEDPGTSLRRLQDTFHRNGIRLVSAAVSTPRGNADRAVGGVVAVLGKSGVSHPQVWDVTAEASYTALLRLLDDCRTNRFPVVPVTLSMRPGPGENKTTYWTLNVCL